MYTALEDCNCVDTLCYLDDFLAWSNTWEENKAKLRRVLVKIRASNLKLTMSKFNFGEVEVEYLRTMVRHGTFVNP